MQKPVFAVLLVIVLSTAAWAQTGGPDAFGYTWANSNAVGGPTYTWLEHTSASTCENMTDDWVSGQISLGFTFPFYGQSYTYIYICSNGIVGFNSDNITTWENAAIPTTDTPNNFIGWFWDDMNPTYSWANTRVYYETITWNGQPAFLVTAVNLAEYNNNGSYPNNCLQGQCMLAQDGTILIQYDWFGSSIDRSNASVGIENIDGTIGLQYAYQNAAMFTDDMAIQFYPPGPECDNDLAALSVIGNPYPSLEHEYLYTVTVENNGALEQTDYAVQLVDAAGNVLTEEDGVTLSYDETAEITLAWTPTDNTIEQIFARVVLTGDENPDNDLSDPLAVSVRTADVNTARVGYGDGLSNRVPLNFYYRTSLTEMLFYSDELAVEAGVLTRLIWQANFYEPCWDKPVRIWVGETASTSLEESWIPSGDLTLVYDGLLDFPAGEHIVQVPLQSFYNYTGGNLVVMVERALDDNSYSEENTFVCTDGTDQYPARVRRWQSDVEQLDPANPMGGQVGGVFANTSLFFTVGPTVVRVFPLSPEGEVYSGIEVTLIPEAGGDALTAITLDWAEFADVTPEFYTLSVNATGFLPYTSEHVRIEASCDIEVTLTDSTRAPQNVACTEHGELTWDAPWEYEVIDGQREAVTYDVLLNGQLIETVTDTGEYAYSYLFESLTVGQSYTAGVRAVFSSGATATATADFTYSGAAVANNETALVTGISGISPNPFNPDARVAFALTSPARVALRVYDVRGRHVRTLVEGNLPAGGHTVHWDGRDDSGQSCASGVYFFRLNALGRNYTQKALLLK